MVVRDDVARRHAGDDRDLEQLGEAHQLGRRPGTQDAATGEDDRALGRGQELDHRADLLVGRSRDAGGRAASSRASSGIGLVEQVLRAATGGPGPGRPPSAWRIASAIAPATSSAASRLGGPLGEAAERRDLVDLLERLAAADGALDLADDHEHRRRILARRVDADGEVGRADRARPEADRRPSGQLAVGLGHERGRALVAGRDDADARRPRTRRAGRGTTRRAP